MRETLGNLPGTVGEQLANAVRVLGLLSLVVTGAGWGVTAMTAMSLSVASLFIPRCLGARPALDTSFGLSLLVAAWSIVLGLYSSWTNWDLFVHTVTNGLIAAMGMVLLVRVGLLPSRLDVRRPGLSIAILTTLLGVTFGVIWEFTEWAGNRFLDSTIYVTYTDTLGDIAAGGLGSLLAGCLMTFLAASPPSRTAPSNPLATQVSTSTP